MKKNLILGSFMLFFSCTMQEQIKSQDLEHAIIRIAEIEIDTPYFEEYISILKEEAAASVRLEPGVLCIYPMYEKDQPERIRLLEIYADQEAYDSHLKTPHFLHYKTSTQEMVKALKLIDMEAIDQDMMAELFRKVENSGTLIHKEN